MEDQAFLLICSVDGRSLLLCDLWGTAVKFRIVLEYSIETMVTNNTCIACGGENRTAPIRGLVFLDMTGNRLQSTPTESKPRSMAFDDYGNRLACGFESGDVVLFGLVDGVWTHLLQWKAAKYAIFAVIWMNDNEICTAGGMGVVSVWHSLTGSLVRHIQERGDIKVVKMLYQSDFIDGKVLLLGNINGTICKCNITDSSCAVFKPHTQCVQAICISDDGMTVITCSNDNTVAAFDSRLFEEKWRFQCLGLAMSAVVIDNEVFVCVLNSRVIVLDILTGRLLRQLSSSCDGRTLLAIDPIHRKVDFAD